MQQTATYLETMKNQGYVTFKVVYIFRNHEKTWLYTFRNHEKQGYIFRSMIIYCLNNACISNISSFSSMASTRSTNHTFIFIVYHVWWKQVYEQILNMFKDIIHISTRHFGSIPKPSIYIA